MKCTSISATTRRAMIVSAVPKVAFCASVRLLISRIRDEEVDKLENYCLANGIRGRKKWGAPFDASCEETRLRFLREISPVTGEAGLEGRRPVRTAADRTMELYRFLVNCGAQEHM